MFPNYTSKAKPDPLMIYKATSDDDTVYMYQAMKQPDYQEFRKSMKSNGKTS